MKLDCQDISDCMDDALDGVFADDERRAFDAHLESCMACRAAVSAERQLLSDLATLGAVAERIADDVTDIQPSAGFIASRRWLRIGNIAAAIALIVTASFLVPRTQTATTVPDSSSRATSDDASVPNVKVEPLVYIDDDTQLAIRMSSENEKMHIYWLYETVQLNDEPAESLPSN